MRRVVPPKAILKQWHRERLSYSDMADRLFAETGERVTSHAFGQALVREGIITESQQMRHDDVLPWEVQSRHLRSYPAKMLRLEGRRRKGAAISETDERRLDFWLKKHRDADAVIWYQADSEKGFYAVKRHKLDAANSPIRHPAVQEKIERAEKAKRV